MPPLFVIPPYAAFVPGRIIRYQVFSPMEFRMAPPRPEVRSCRDQVIPPSEIGKHEMHDFGLRISCLASEGWTRGSADRRQSFDRLPAWSSKQVSAMTVTATKLLGSGRRC